MINLPNEIEIILSKLKIFAINKTNRNFSDNVINFFLFISELNINTFYDFSKNLLKYTNHQTLRNLYGLLNIHFSLKDY